MITRLADRIEKGPEGDVHIRRYGMWGTSAEIEARETEVPKIKNGVVVNIRRIGYFVVSPDGTEKKFTRKVDAELFLKEHAPV